MATPAITPPPLPEPDLPAGMYYPYPPPPEWPNPGTGAYYPYLQPRPNTAGDTRDWASTAATVLGGLLLCVGSLMPWITTYDNQGVYNLDGLGGGTRDGVLTLPLGCVILGIGIARFAVDVPEWIQRSLLALGLAGTAVAVIDMNQVHTGLDRYIAAHNWEVYNAGGGGYPGAGLYVVLVGAILAAIGGLNVTRSSAVAPKPFVAPKPTVAPTATKRPLVPWFPAGTEAWVVGLVLVLMVAVVLWTGWVVSL